MTERTKLWKRPEALHLLSALGLAATTWQFRLRFPFDDTFISFRYAEHLASGHGLVWNIGGPHCEGYTNFLFIVLLAAARFATTDLLATAQLIGVLSTIATGLLIFRTVRDLCGSLAGILATLLYYLTPLTWVNALSGMETSLFVMLVVLAIFFVARQQYRAAFLISFLATLTRPEGALLAVIIVTLLLPFERKKNILMDFCVWFVLPALLYLIWKYCYFGELLPNSFYVKVVGTSKSMPGFQYVRLFVTSTFVLVLFSLGLRRLRNPALLVATVWAFALIAFYLFVTPLEGLYDRFLWPAFGALCISAAAGQTDFAVRFRPRMGGILALALVAGHLALSYLSPRSLQAFHAHEEVWDASMDKVVEKLRQLPDIDSLTIAYGDAGYVVYKSGVRHLDLFGLNDTRIAHAKTRGERAAIVVSEQPDVLMLPVRRSDTGYVMVEDAYGLARAPQFTRVGVIDAFPFPIAFYLNGQSRYASRLALSLASSH